MKELAILCVSYNKDFDFLKNQILSIKKYNVDNISTVLIVPQNDILTIENSDFNYFDHIIPEEELTHYINLKPIKNFRYGYILQGAIKLNIWRLGIAKNYFVIDSDSYFIKDFRLTDFINEDGLVYSILHQEKDMRVDPSFRSYDIPRQPKLESIRNSFQLVDSRIYQVQTAPILSAQVLKSLKEIGMKEIEMDYTQMFELAPYEYSWYSFWLQKSKIIPIIPIEPLIKTFYTRSQYLNAIKEGITLSDITRGYIGMNKNSSWYREYLAASKWRKIRYNLNRNQLSKLLQLEMDF